jgi:UDP-galactopyranose mutase
MRKYLDQITIHNNDPKNSWEACLNKLGTEICTKVYRNYIHKKWNLNPEDLVKEEFDKFPISLEDLTQSFYTDQFQGLPEEGYTKFFEKMLSSHKITILYSTNYFQIKTMLRSNIETYYSGSLDSYFSNLKLPKL